jgi:hypothetical protein
VQLIERIGVTLRVELEFASSPIQVRRDLPEVNAVALTPWHSPIDFAALRSRLGPNLAKSKEFSLKRASSKTFKQTPAFFSTIRRSKNAPGAGILAPNSLIF